MRTSAFYRVHFLLQSAPRLRRQVHLKDVNLRSVPFLCDVLLLQNVWVDYLHRDCHWEPAVVSMDFPGILGQISGTCSRWSPSLSLRVWVACVRVCTRVYVHA